MGCLASASNNHHSKIHIMMQPANPLAKQKTKKKFKAIDNRLKSVDIQDAPSALITARDKTLSDIQLIQLALNRHFLFNNLTPEQRKLVISEMTFYSVKSNSLIFKQDTPGNNFFIICSGTVEVLINDIQKSILKPGDSFGELALLHGTLRNATVKSLDPCEFWSLDRKTFKKVVHSINSLVYKENKKFIENVGLFSMLTEEQQDFLLNSLSTQQFVPGYMIVYDGDPGRLFYIVKEGMVSVIKDGKEIRQMGKGDYFGEQALLYSGNRTASVLTLTPTICLSIAAESLLLALGSKLQNAIYKNSLKIAAEKDRVISKLSHSQIARVVDVVTVATYKKNDIIFTAGFPVNAILNIVVKGQVRCGEKKFNLFDCIESEKFCHNSSEEFKEDLIAVENSDIGQIPAEHFLRVIGGDYSVVTTENKIIKTLNSIPVLSGMSQEDLIKVMKSMKIQKFNPDSTVFAENDPGEYFFIIRKGALDVYREEKFLRSLYKFDYFGERSLLFNIPRSATVKTQSNVELWTLKSENFSGLFPEPLKSRLLRKIELQDNTISLSDLEMIKMIGKGMFGNVFLVAHKTRGTLYALKAVSRKKIEAYSLQKNLILERNVLFLIDHSMIMKLVKTFKDSHRVYFLLEYVAGTDLFEVLRILNILSESDSRFYISCLLTILEHLHSKNIIYRDLKPENVIIDSEGYPKLIDFGISKILKGRTFSLVGTPHYMPPEIIEGKGYNTTADFWNLGIMLYEFLCASVPFGDDDEEPYAIYEKILQHNLVFPPWVENLSACKSLIEQLLNKNPGLRLGGHVRNLKEHGWFFGINWDKIMVKQLKPPFLPAGEEVNVEKYRKANGGKELSDVILTEEKNEVVVEAKIRCKIEVDERWDDEF